MCMDTRGFWVVLLWVITGSFVGVSAQSISAFPYHLEWRKELPLLMGGGALSAAGHLAESRLPGLTPAELATLTPARVPAFDRSAIGQQSEAFRQASDELLRAAALTPGLLFLGRPARQKTLIIAVLAAETFLITEGLTKTTKVILRRSRPFTYDPTIAPEAKQGNDARQSFPSGHTSVTASLSFFTAKVLHDLYPESPWRPLIWGGAALLPAITGYARYRAGRHFPTDIIAGYLLGGSVGILIPQWHKKKDANTPEWSVTEHGMGLVWHF